MSAIAGLWRFDGKPDAAADCARMLASQEIYGPADGRQWCDGTVAMGRRLFRLLPEDADDRQPLVSSDGRFVLVADVRLDNRDELTTTLRLPPERNGSLCDAAILLESLECWGEAALDRLVGDFAFALWDSHAQRLLLARDFLGQRPLHYHRANAFFAFASMPKGLHALPEIPYGADEQVMAEFITLIPQTGPRSFFQCIDRVEAGHCVTITRNGVSIRRYWEPRRPGGTRRRFDDYVEGLRHHLDLATGSRLRGATGDVGAQLSGGFDSSAVTATAARLLAPSGRKVVAFTAVPREGYDGPCPKDGIGDEGPLAAATAAMYPNIEHVLVRAGDSSPLGELDRTFFLFERPWLNLCNWNWARAIYTGARERRLGVLLNGQTGNMSVSYTGLEALPELLRAGHMVRLWRGVTGLTRNRGVPWRSALTQTFGPYVPRWFWQWTHGNFEGRRRDILRNTAIRADRLAALDLARLARERDLDFSYRPWKDGFAMRLWAMGRVDMGCYNKGTLAGWDLDRRDPTGDKRLVEYCLSVPTEQYLGNGVPRGLARRVLADRLPREVLDERRKGYQAVDWHESLTAARGDITAELSRLASCPLAERTLDLPRLKSLLEIWPASGWERADVTQSYRSALLRGISAGHFMRKAAERSQ